VAHQLVGKLVVAGLTISQTLTSSHIEGDVRLPDLVSQSHSHPPLYREAGECETKVRSVQKNMFARAAQGSSSASGICAGRGRAQYGQR
jgi:hypothetical protein